MSIEKAYELAREQYAEIGIDTDKAIERLKNIPISIHCWQGDDVAGFENLDGSLDGGLAVTGNYPGKAKTPDQLRADMSFAFKLIPGPKKANIHAFYSEPKAFCTRCRPSLRFPLNPRVPTRRRCGEDRSV